MEFMTHRSPTTAKESNSRTVAQLLTLALSFCSPALTFAQQRSVRAAEIPRTRDEKALADWVTPPAGIDVQPSSISSERYYALPVDHLTRYWHEEA